jgi:hypothetical protein
VAVLAAITVASAWSARRTTEPWLTWCAALLPLTLALQYAVWLWNAWPRAPWLTTPGVVLTLLPLLLALGAAVGLPGPGAVRRIPVVVTVTSVALTASVVFALPAAAMRLWWGFALSSRAFTMAALAVAVVLVVLVVGWIRRGDATTQPRPTRRLQVLGTLALVALVSSLPWLYNERVSPGSPVALALAGQVVLLLMPAVFIVLAPERRSARRIIVTAAATQLVILVDWPVAAAFWRLPRPSLILGLAGFVLAGALLLAAAALVAVPRAESSPDGSGKHTA